MLCQVAFGYYKLKGEVPEGVTVREDLPKDATLSIVIPAYREAATIEATLRRVAQAASWPSRCEVIVVDAGGGEPSYDCCGASRRWFVAHGGQSHGPGVD